MKPKPDHHIIVEAAERLAADIQKLTDAGVDLGHRPATADLIAEVLTKVTKIDARRRTSNGSPAVAFLRRARKGDNAGAVLIERLDWHHGRSCSLWGPMVSQHKVTAESWALLDTIATLLALHSGKAGQSASDRWRKALGC